LRILVAEDDDDIRSLLCVTVETLDHEVVAARDGLEAWELYQAQGADVIISDWLMPRMEGTELCRRVREAPGPYTYFVILTALEGERNMIDGMVAGADDYLTKPFTIGALQARLVAAERVTRLHRELARRDREQEEALIRRAAVLRVARQFAAEADPNRLLNDLIVQAVALVGGVGGVVFRWDEQGGVLAPVAQTEGTPEVHPLRLGEHAAGTAAERREPYFAAGAAEGRDAMAVPLLHEGRLLGSLMVAREDGGSPPSEDDVESLELLAGITAAALVGLERAQLEAVTLAAREVAHVLNNDLALPVGVFELLQDDPDLPPHLREMMEGSAQGLAAAVEHVRRLQQIVRFERKQTPVGPALDLDRSTSE
jgi:CheY-like chemotaxis protein